MAREIKGVVAPIFTQFDSRGDVDPAAMAAHMDALLEAGVDGIFAGGSAGEFIALDAEERETITSHLISRRPKEIPFLVHVTAQNLRDSLRLADHAIAAGADALVAVSPWFWKHDDDSLAAFFGAIADRAGSTPLYLYNMPHTGNDLSPELVQRLVRRYPTIVGLKNSQNDLARSIAYSRMPDTAFFTGSDMLWLYSLPHGTTGIISGMINVVPEMFVDLQRSYQAGDLARAFRMQVALHELADLFAGDIRSMKAAAELRGYGSRRCREPLLTLSDNEFEALRERLSALTAAHASG